MYVHGGPEKGVRGDSQRNLLSGLLSDNWHESRGASCTVNLKN
jgi:hypothetical protein